ncbi:hypothetical protein NE237_027775 [Protea cynaroides]|uniref:DUF7815 domain-containing protein n=1 Tax=Protea cynaroides TaxID=273540 RepID=A0A9Q0JUP4_9MAGN|nr:hypothetical protein NE237_027775 [Protea cynaroides]
MASEIPISLIREVQIAIRKEAGLASYDPDDPSLPDLPSIKELISEFDPSPPYLRCKQCKGRLLRGLQSIVCVYCGASQRKELPPDPLPFKTTFGYRWLLESLNLDGSETIDLSAGVNDSTKSQNASKEEMILSDLLDIKLHWPAEPEETEISFTSKAPVQNKFSLNFSGVDLDRFFSEKKEVGDPSLSMEDLFSNEQFNKEMQGGPGQGSLNLFENVQSSGKPVRPLTTMADGNPISDWTAEFQSGGSGTFPGDSKSLDPTMGSPTMNASSPVEAAFSPVTHVNFQIDSTNNNVKLKNHPEDSESDDWVRGNAWDSSSTGISGKTEQFDLNIETNNFEPISNSNNLSSSGDIWFQDDQYQNSSMKVAKSERINEDDDSMDAWHDFTSSGNVADPFSNSSEQNSIATTPSVTQASDTNMVGLSNDSSDPWNDFTSSGNVPDPSSNSSKLSGTATTNTVTQVSDTNMVGESNDFHDMDFGSFSQPDLFSGASSIRNISMDMNNMQLEASVSDRMVEMDVKTEADGKKAASVDGSPITTMQSKAADHSVEMLIKEMPDLSFMLQKDLAIPQNRDGFNSVM